MPRRGIVDPALTRLKGVVPGYSARPPVSSSRDSDHSVSTAASRM